MTQYEIELRKLVALPATMEGRHEAAGDYGKLVDSLANLFIMKKEEDRRSAAIETLYRAVQLVAIATMPKAVEAFGLEGDGVSYANDDFDKMMANYSNSLDNQSFVCKQIQDWANAQPWASEFTDYERIGVVEHIVRYVFFLIYWRNGVKVNSFTGTGFYVLPLATDSNRQGEVTNVTSSAYDVSDHMLDLMNIEPGCFEQKFEEFKAKVGLESCGFFLDSDASESRLSKINWRVLSDAKSDIIRFWGLCASKESNHKFQKTLTRLLKMQSGINTPPVDMAQLQRDVETLDESVQRRFNLLTRWLTQKAETTYLANLDEATAMELAGVTAKLASAEGKLVIAAAMQLKAEELAKDYAKELENALAVLHERDETIKELKSEYNVLEARIAQKDEEIATLQQQLEIQKSGSGKMKKMEDLIEQVRAEAAEAKSSRDEAIATAVLLERSVTETTTAEAVVRCIRRFYKFIRVEEKRYDWILNCSQCFRTLPLVDKLITDFTNELEDGENQKEEESKQKQQRDEERADRIADAMERQADKPAGPIHMYVKPGGFAVGNIEEMKGLTNPDKLKEIEG